jgi:hypothetical protein
VSSLDLNAAWNYLNDAAFAGEMKKPCILAYRSLIFSHTERGNKAYLFGAYHPPQNGVQGYPSEILVFRRLTKEDQLETLYHEMCHQFCHEILGEPNTGHGPLFWNIYNEGVIRLAKAKKKASKGSKGSKGGPRTPSYPKM